MLQDPYTPRGYNLSGARAHIDCQLLRLLCEASLAYIGKQLLKAARHQPFQEGDRETQSQPCVQALTTPSAT